MAFDLIEAGDADAMVVIAAEHVGDVVRDLFAATGSVCPVDGALGAVLKRAPRGIDRGRLAALRTRVGSGDSALGDPAPGWPAFAAVLAELGVGGRDEKLPG